MSTLISSATAKTTKTMAKTTAKIRPQLRKHNAKPAGELLDKSKFPKSLPLTRQNAIIMNQNVLTTNPKARLNKLPSSAGQRFSRLV